MDFKDVILQLSERVVKLKGLISTEEATKTSLVLPFIQALGYDFFNPNEVVPEYTCDIGTKKGEKVDYAICKDGAPIILIECKHWEQDLNLHDNQLLRYFAVSNVKFGVLTNGIIYRFYFDLSQPNKMDEKPFLEIDFSDLKVHLIDELKKFHKTYFNLDNILSSASELKYLGEFKNLLLKEFANPSEEFVSLLARKVFDKKLTQKYLDMFTPLVRKSIENHINDIFSERLKKALKSETTNDEVQPKPEPQDKKKNELPEGVIYISEDGKIVTTQEEIEGYYVVLSILRSHIDPKRITYRDSQSYFSILVDDTNRRPVCRLYFNIPENKQISFIGEDKKEVKYKIQTLNDIFDYSEQLISTIGKYIQ